MIFLYILFFSIVIIIFVVIRKEVDIKPASEYSVNNVQQLGFPIDIVITWVDGNDEERNKLREIYKKKQDNIKKEAVSSRRYVNHDELKYLLRSIDRYIPWIHRIHVISSDQPPPDWLMPNETLGFDFDINTKEKTANKPILRWVNDRTILKENCLPTFNSHALESAIHRLDELTEHFLYFCDDMFVTHPFQPSNIFTNQGIPKVCAHYWTRPYRLDPCVNSQTWRKIWSEMSIQYPTKKKWMNNHVATPLTKQLMIDAEKYWGNDWLLTQSNKFRSGHDVQPIAAAVIFGQVNNEIIKNEEIISKFIMFMDYHFLNRANMAFALSAKPHLLCINDDIEQPEKFSEQWDYYLNILWPFHSNWEVT